MLRDSAVKVKVLMAGVGMLNRGKLQYFGIQHPAQWQSLPNLAAVPLDEELLIIKDTQMDCRWAVSSDASESRCLPVVLS
jgi:hypothetical protein